MKISREHAFLFVHVPRTAGSSIAGALAPFCIPERRRYPFKALSKMGLVRNWQRRDYRIHTSLAEAERWIPRPVWDRLFKFAVVRNPWDWLVSRYYHRRRRVGGSMRRRRSRHVDCLEAFLCREAARVRTDPKATQTGMIRTRAGRLGLDRILRFESLQEDWEALLGQLGIRAALPHWNRTVHDDWRTLYGPEERALVATAWAEDIAALGYTFEAGPTPGGRGGA